MHSRENPGKRCRRYSSGCAQVTGPAAALPSGSWFELLHWMSTIPTGCGGEAVGAAGCAGTVVPAPAEQ